MSPVKPSQIGKLKAEAVSSLKPAFDRSSVHFAELWVDRCEQDLAQLWKWPDFWAITEVQSAKQGLVLHIVAAAGRFDPIYLSDVESWGVSVGCVEVFLSGRKGWLKKFPDFKLETVTLRKRLKNV